MRHEAIRKAHPNVSTISTNDNETIALDKDNNIVSLDKTKVAEEEAKLQAEYDSKQYQRDRSSAYPSWQDQMDMLYHKGDAGWKAEIKKVKDANPKPSE